MRSRAMLVLTGLLMVACSGPQPVQVAAGDVCFQCRRMIMEPRYAAELIDKDGRAFKFNTAGCMAKFLKANPGQEFAGMFATDFVTGRMVKVSAVKFVPTMIGEGAAREKDYVAFYAETTANDAAQREKTTPVTWEQVLAEATPN
jgi:hypothetical protein